ncbi:MAG: hypothetical protein PHQ93_01925 [Sulfurimonas sp.]|nr:hypothetical protein [Sulfurimonas sp.]MDD5399933.1 hypothetical protein [Sulfurimonas sp.]
MPNFAEPVSFTFIAVTVAVIFIIIAVGIVSVKAVKKQKEI